MSQFSIRAMPPGGAARRHRIGRSWGSDPVIVTVVDSPSPPREDKDRDGKKFLTFSNEISPAQLEAIRADPHFAVSPVGGAADPLQLNEAKAKAIALEEQLVEARRCLAELAEEHKAYRSGVMKDAEDKGAEIVRLQQELAEARSAVASKTKREK